MFMYYWDKAAAALGLEGKRRVEGVGGVVHALLHSLDSVTGLPVAQESINGVVPVTDALNLAGNTQVTLAISSIGAQTAALAPGKYAVWTTTDCFIQVDTTASDVTTSTGYPVYSSATPLFINISSATHKIGAITTSASGTLSYHKVG